MTLYQIHRLRNQLYNRIPLIGRLLQRQAARALARYNSPRAIEALAETLDFHPDLSVQKIARQAIEQVSKPTMINAVCQVWFKTRQSWLDALIQQRGWVASEPPEAYVWSALKASKLDLLEEANDSLVKLLVQACQDSDTQIAGRALETLHHLRRPNAISAFCSLWAENRSPVLEKILLRAGYIARRPAEARLLTALKQGQLAIPRNIRAAALPALLQAAEDRDPGIASQARQALVELKHPETRQSVCRVFLEEGNALAGEVALQAGYLPAEPFQRALFYFFSGQWESYQELDFEQRILRSAYETAEAGLRQRILEKIRISGQAGLLQAISGRMLVVQDIAEAEALARLFIEHKDWERAWAKVFEFPFSCGLQLLNALAKQGWQPANPEEQSLLLELGSLIQDDLEISADKLREQLPAALLRARANLLAGRINAVAFAPRQPVIAVGTSGGKAVIWDFQRGQRSGLLHGFAHSIGQAAYSAAGELLVAERTNGNTPCAAFIQRGENAMPIWQRQGSITALAAISAPDTNSPASVIVAGRDGSIALIELGSTPRAIATVQLSDWPRAVQPSPDGKQLVALNSCLELLSLPELHNPLPGQMRYTLGGIARFATFTPDGQGLVVGMNSGRMEWRSATQPGQQPQQVIYHQDKLQGLATLQRHALILSADASGEVRFTTAANNPATANNLAWADRPMAGKIVHSSAAEKSQSGKLMRTTSLHISPDESFMALGHSDAHLTLWDMRPLDLPDLLRLPLAASTPNQLAALNLVQDLPELPEKTRRTLIVLLRLLRHRFRFDIEVGEIASIQAGEYDIEIE